MTINALIDQYNAAETEAQRESLKQEIHFQYYHASAAERSIVRVAMQPFLDEIEQEMIAKDPLARQAYELLNRSKTAKATVER